MRGEHQVANDTHLADVPSQKAESTAPKRSSLIESLLPLRAHWGRLRLVTAPPPPRPERAPEAATDAAVVDAVAVNEATEPQLAPSATPWLDTTRVLSALALLIMLAAIFETFGAAYHALTDSFVTPIILSPDSDLVLPSKLSLAHLLAERQTQEVRVSEAKQAIAVAQEGIQKLSELQRVASQSVVWSDTITSQSRAASASDLQMIAKQRRILETHIEQQQAYVEELKRSVDSGLARKSDLNRELSQLRQMRISALDNERAHVASATTYEQTSLAQEALHQNTGTKALVTPEMLQRKDQLVRIELELVRLEADIESRRGEVRVATDMVAKLDELITAMKKRPIFRAIETKQNVAFVPYTQADSVRVGADVYACGLFGIFACESVGMVVEVLPGEINMDDPWGTPTRGQYALLNLKDPDAAKARSLRVRGGSSGRAAAQNVYSRVVK